LFLFVLSFESLLRPGSAWMKMKMNKFYAIYLLYGVYLSTVCVKSFPSFAMRWTRASMRLSLATS